jgi:hypothetical protein
MAGPLRQKVATQQKLTKTGSSNGKEAEINAVDLKKTKS